MGLVLSSFPCERHFPPVFHVTGSIEVQSAGPVTSSTWHTIQFHCQIQINQSLFQSSFNSTIYNNDVILRDIPVKIFPPLRPNLDGDGMRQLNAVQ